MIGWTLFSTEDEFKKYKEQRHKNIALLMEIMNSCPSDQMILDHLFTSFSPSLKLTSTQPKEDCIIHLTNVQIILQANFCIYVLLTIKYFQEAHEYKPFWTYEYYQGDSIRHDDKRREELRFDRVYKNEGNLYTKQFPIIKKDNAKRLESEFYTKMDLDIISRPLVIQDFDVCIKNLRSYNYKDPYKLRSKRKKRLRDFLHYANEIFTDYQLKSSPSNTLKNHIREMIFHHQATYIASMRGYSCNADQWIWEYEKLLSCPLSYRVLDLLTFAESCHIPRFPYLLDRTSIWEDLCLKIPMIFRDAFSALHAYYHEDLQSIENKIMEYYKDLLSKDISPFYESNDFSQLRYSTAISMGQNIDAFTDEELEKLINMLNTIFKKRDTYSITIEQISYLYEDEHAIDNY